MPMEPIWLQCYCAGAVRCERCGSEAVRDVDTAGSKRESTCADCGTVRASWNPASRLAVAPDTMTHAISAVRSDAGVRGAREFQGHDLSSRRRRLLAMMASVIHWTERMVWPHQPIIR